MPAMTDSEAGHHRGNNLDLLRLVFASLVLVSHAPELIDGTRQRELLSVMTGGGMSFGEFAVNGFFALSGYLIMGSWLRRPHLGDYFRNRALRIYPGFIVASCLSVLVVGPLGQDSSYFSAFTARQFLMSLLTLRDPWFAYSFPGQPYPLVNGALWTISYEFACYIAVAVVGFLASTHLRHVWLAMTAALLIGACFLPELHPMPHVSRFAVDDLVRLSAIFFSGATLALFGFRMRARPSVLMIAWIAFVALLASPRFATVGFAVFGSIVLLSVGLRGPKLGLTRSWPDISYGVYLFGWPIQKLLHWYGPELGPAGLLCLSLPIALGCGYLSWALVEARFMTLKTRALRPSTQPR